MEVITGGKKKKGDEVKKPSSTLTELKHEC
jgi:hypothetical protein